MEVEDLKYFDDKFGDIAKTQGDLRTDFTAHVNRPCKDSKEHVKEFHGPEAQDRERKKIKAIARDEIAKAVPTSSVARWKHIAGAVAALATIVAGIVAVVLAFA